MADSSAAASIALDRPERPLAPLPDAFRLERVAVERSHLEHGPVSPQVEVTPAEPQPAPPSPELGEPPAPEPVRAATMETRELKPPIPRGMPPNIAAGRGGRVTLDVRVDENGDVSDVLLVGSDADSLAVRAAIEAASSVRFHPALLGGKPTAVWTRQMFEVRRGRGPR
jgi:TonB family protein